MENKEARYKTDTIQNSDYENDYFIRSSIWKLEQKFSIVSIICSFLFWNDSSLFFVSRPYVRYLLTSNFVQHWVCFLSYEGHGHLCSPCYLETCTPVLLAICFGSTEILKFIIAFQDIEEDGEDVKEFTEDGH